MTLILNFHGIGTAQRAFEEGEEPYWIDEQRFHDCLDLAEGSPQDILLTFDDSNASDFDIAYHALAQRKMKAIFFVLAGKIGQTGYLSQSNIRTIEAHQLMEIGSHGMDHRPWSELGAAELSQEIVTSRQILSALCEREITAAGLPFGRYNRNVLTHLRKHGYRDIYSSDGAAKLTKAAPLPRFSVRADTPLEALEIMIMHKPTLPTRMKNELRACIKAMMP